MERKHIVPTEAKKFIQQKLYAFNAGEELAWAWNAGENILLTGPGGYGKTDAAGLFFEFLKEQEALEDKSPFVLAFGQGMTEERLFAGLDIKRFQNEGELIYNLKKAFVSFEYVVFEEMFDAFPGVLLILKDVLQSRMVRLGDEVFPLRTKFIVACTNRSNEEVATDRSTWALLERFVFQKEVTWTSWERSDYQKAFEAATGLEADDIAKAVAAIAARSSAGEMKISPRTAGKALKAVRKNGNELRVLNSILGFDQKAVKAAIDEHDAVVANEKQLAEVSAIRQLCTTIAQQSESLQSGIKIAVEAKKIHVEIQKLQLITKRDACVEAIKEALGRMNQELEIMWTRAQSYIINPKENTLAFAIKNASTKEFNWELIRL